MRRNPERVTRQIKKVEEIYVPELPYELHYLWIWFQEVSLGLSISGFGYPTITWEGLRAWKDLMNISKLEHWECLTLIQLASLRAGILTQQSKTGKNTADKDNRASDRIARQDSPRQIQPPRRLPVKR
jgi:hypothetical protein